VGKNLLCCCFACLFIKPSRAIVFCFGFVLCFCLFFFGSFFFLVFVVVFVCYFRTDGSYSAAKGDIVHSETLAPGTSGPVEVQGSVRVRIGAPSGPRTVAEVAVVYDAGRVDGLISATGDGADSRTVTVVVSHAAGSGSAAHNVVVIGNGDVVQGSGCVQKKNIV
jgi:hypothetical protein